LAQAFQKFLAGNVFVGSFGASEGALGVFKSFLNKNVGVVGIAGVRLHYSSNVIFQFSNTHITIERAQALAPLADERYDKL
jgi:hypothetical protein